MLLFSILILVLLFILAKLSSDKIQIKEFSLSGGPVHATVVIIYHGLVKLRSDTGESNIDKVMVCYLKIDIESIDMDQVF